MWSTVYASRVHVVKNELQWHIIRREERTIAIQRSARPQRKIRLTRKRVLRAAMAQADQGGIEALTMRNLAEALGAAPMSLYRHVANKSDLLDGLVDMVFAEIGLPPTETDWKTAMRQRAISARDVLLRHRWAVTFMESRTSPGPVYLGHHDAVLGCLRAAGFSVVMAAHAYSLLDSYIYGMALTQVSMRPAPASPEEMEQRTASILARFPAGKYPNLIEWVREIALKPGHDYGNEFFFGLELILEALDAVRHSA